MNLMAAFWVLTDRALMVGILAYVVSVVCHRLWWIVGGTQECRPSPLRWRGWASLQLPKKRGATRGFARNPANEVTRRMNRIFTIWLPSNHLPL